MKRGYIQYTIAKETSWKPVQGGFVKVLHVRKSHWLTVSNKHCPPGTTCVYDSTRGATTADTKNQVAAIMHSLQGSGDCAWRLEVMAVDLQISGSDCGLHAVTTVYELCAGNDPTGITSTSLTSLEMPEREAIKPFRGKVRDQVALLGLQFEPPFFASAVCQKNGQRSWL